MVPAVRSQPDGWLSVMDALQRQVAREFGLQENVGLQALRHAEALLPGDDEVVEISLYRKYNRCWDGLLQVGDLSPNPLCHQLDSHSSVPLHDLLAGIPQAQVVLLAGSLS